MSETRLPKIATALHALSIVALALFPALFLLALSLPALGMLDISDFTDIPRDEWPVMTWIGLFVGLIPAVFLWLAVNAMRRLFALYQKGDPLAPQAGPLIKSIGSNLFISALAAIAVVPVQSGLMSLANPVGERQISVSLNSSTLGFVLVSGLLLLIGWSMSEATRLAAENKEFI
ncbi:hypothetical protein L0664_11460 [Octadecabacter sp. G9-8]|uniref:DUF2975 domain-containing protein n=1 Tax=Octadecabacter dasysiphoniae TaxID=2909341 RepID=A0ABS9CWV6_9RHOB|nr:hypothetical protein [Octadecabacter dasysiphoniae]MCF2871684.1 hypothetical protein [Octadecabacter dasysiphoniae]